MRLSGTTSGAGLVAMALAAFMLSGCVAAGVATVAAGGGLGYAYSKEPPPKTASAAPAAGREALPAAPATASQPAPQAQPAAGAYEPLDMGQPAILVEPRAPVESVEVQPIY